MSPTINTSSLSATSENPIYKFSPARQTSDSGSDVSGSSSDISVPGGGGGGGGAMGIDRAIPPRTAVAGYATDTSPAVSRKTPTGSFASVRREEHAEGEEGGWQFVGGRDGGEEKRAVEEAEVEVELGAAKLVHLPDLHARDSSSAIGKRVVFGGKRGSGGASGVATYFGDGTAADHATGVGISSRDTAAPDGRDVNATGEPERPAFPASASVSLPSSTTALEYLLRHHHLLQHNSSSSATTGATPSSAISAVESREDIKGSAADSGGSAFRLSGVYNSSTPIASLATNSPVDYLSRYHGRQDQNASTASTPDRDDANADGIIMTRTTDTSLSNVAGKLSSYPSSPSSITSTPFATDSPQSPAEKNTGRDGVAGDREGDVAERNASASTKRQNRKGRPHDAKSAGFQFFHVEPCLYTHRMFLRAAKIFEVLKSEDSETVEAKATRRRMGETHSAGAKPKIPDMDFRDAHEQIKTFELTFAALKYQDLFREILERTGFFHEFSNLRSDYSLVCIILYDLQSRKFQRRVPLPEELEGVYQNEAISTSATATATDTSTSTAVPSATAVNAAAAAAAAYAAEEDGNNLKASIYSDITNRQSSIHDVDTGSSSPPGGSNTAIIAVGHLDEVCLEIENALLSRKTRFQSNIAKERIKRNAPSLEHLLPETVRNKDETKSSTPVFCWVNQLKASMEKIIESLIAEGFQELAPGLDISEQTESVFRRDHHCSDLLVFPPHLNMYFKGSDWVKTGQLVQQDKSSCLAPQTVQLLLGIDQDVIHVNVGTGMTTAHIASLLKLRSPHSHVWAFGPEDAEKAKRAARNLEFLGVKNTRILQENFLNVDPEDMRYKSVRVIMITANCSKSAITSPVQFIVSEGEDMQILGGLSQADSNIARVRELTYEHEGILRHALKFPRVQAVVYTTRSRYQAENEQVVHQALEYVNGASLNSKRVPFRVTPPVLPFTGDEIGTGKAASSAAGVVNGRFACFSPTDKSNGCFVAIVSREPEDPKEIARSAIARARTKGMLGKGDAESATPTGVDGGDDKPAASGSGTGKGRGRNRKSTGAAEAKSGVSGLKQKLSNHKSPAAIGARLYQAGLISRMEQAKVRPHRPEHVRVIKHPAPFSDSAQALKT